MDKKQLVELQIEKDGRKWLISRLDGRPERIVCLSPQDNALVVRFDQGFGLIYPQRNYAHPVSLTHCAIFLKQGGRAIWTCPWAITRLDALLEWAPVTCQFGENEEDLSGREIPELLAPHEAAKKHFAGLMKIEVSTADDAYAKMNYYVIGAAREFVNTSAIGTCRLEASANPSIDTHSRFLSEIYIPAQVAIAQPQSSGTVIDNQ